MRHTLKIGLLFCLLAAPWPALGASAAVAVEQGGWTLEPSKTVSVFDDLAARPCGLHSNARPAQRAARPPSSGALSLAAAPVATSRPAAHRAEEPRLPENRRDLHLRNGVLLI